MNPKEKQLTILARLIEVISNDPEVRQVITGCVIKDEAQWLNTPVTIKIEQSGKASFIMQIKNNSENGITEIKRQFLF